MDLRLVGLVVEQRWTLYVPVSWDTRRCHSINELSGRIVAVVGPIEELEVGVLLVRGRSADLLP